MTRPLVSAAARAALGTLVAFPPAYVVGLVLTYTVLAPAAPGADPVAPGWQLASLCCPAGAAWGLRRARGRGQEPRAPLVRALLAGSTGAWLGLSLVMSGLYYFPRPVTLLVGAVTGPALAALAVTALVRRGRPAPAGPVAGRVSAAGVPAAEASAAAAPADRLSFPRLSFPRRSTLRPAATRTAGGRAAPTRLAQALAPEEGGAPARRRWTR